MMKGTEILKTIAKKTEELVVKIEAVGAKGDGIAKKDGFVEAVLKQK